MNRISKQEIKQINQYKIKKYRQQNQLFVAEGSKVVFELLQSSIPVKRVIVTDSLLRKYNSSTWGNVDIVLADENEFKKMSSQKNPDGILALCEIPQYNAQSFDFSKWTIALDGLNDPGNLGTIIRIADWFGVTQILCNEQTVDAYNPKVVQSSMGSIARVKLLYQPFHELLPSIKYSIYAADLDGVSIYETNELTPGILVIGNESHGVSEQTKSLVSEKITIPRFGKAESLNAGVATGILLSHLCR